MILLGAFLIVGNSFKLNKTKLFELVPKGQSIQKLFSALELRIEKANIWYQFKFRFKIKYSPFCWIHTFSKIKTRRTKFYFEIIFELQKYPLAICYHNEYFVETEIFD